MRNVREGDSFTLTLSQVVGVQVFRELQFDEKRKWRFDYAIPSAKLAIEVDGGVWMDGGGRHTRGSGWTKDQQKLNEAAAQGWRVLHVTPQQKFTSYLFDIVRKCLQ